MKIITRSMIAAIALAPLGVTAASAEEYYLSAQLKGAAEVPGPGDGSATGTADIMLDTEKLRLCYTISSTGITKATMAHIHKGKAGVAGDPVLSLTVDGSGNSKQCVDVVKDVADAIGAAPGDYYVNVHDEAFPAGAIRGQLEAE